MRRGRKSSIALLLYIGGVFVLGTFAVYPVVLGLEALGASDLEFHSLLGRTWKLLAVAGLVPVLIWLGINDRKHWGFAMPRHQFVRHLVGGFAFGAVSLGMLVAVLLLLGVRVDHARVSYSAVEMLWLIARIVVTALILGLVEEAWFRGALHSIVRRAAGTTVAIALTATLYALVHFLKGDASMVPQQVDWFSGFTLLASIFSRLARPEIVDSAIALLVGGVLLGLARHATGSIAICIGMHAGWVVVIKIAKATTRLDHDSAWRWLAGDYDGVIGYLGAAWFVVLSIAYYWWYVRKFSRTGDQRGD